VSTRAACGLPGVGLKRAGALVMVGCLETDIETLQAPLGVHKYAQAVSTTPSIAVSVVAACSGCPFG
jgi:hypothetical protein